MTIIKRKSKLLILLSLLLAVCIGMMFFIKDVPAAAADVIVPTDNIFPVDKVKAAGNSNSNSYAIKTEGGIVLSSTVSYPQSFSYTYEYPRKIYPNGLNDANKSSTEDTNCFSLQFTFDSSYSTNDTVLIILEAPTTKFEWRIMRYNNNTIYIDLINNGTQLNQTYAISASISAQLTVGFRKKAGTVGAGVVYEMYVTGTASDSSAIHQIANKNLWENAQSTLKIRHNFYDAFNYNNRTTTMTLKKLCNVDLTQVATGGIKDVAAPSIYADAQMTTAILDGSATGGTGTQADPIKMIYGKNSKLDFVPRAIYDIFGTDKNSMLFTVKDTILSSGKEYLWVREGFADKSGEFTYNPYQLFGVVLPVGEHKLTLSVQKQNGQIGSHVFYITIVSAQGGNNINPVINAGYIPPKSDYCTNVIIDDYSAADLCGTLVPVTLIVTDPNGVSVNTTGKKFFAGLLGEYKYTYIAIDVYGNRTEKTGKTISEKTTAPALKENVVATKPEKAINTIYYKENTAGYLLSAEEAKTAIFDDINPSALAIAIEIEKYNGLIWQSVTLSNSFVPADAGNYRVTYKATDVANNSTSVSFELIIKNDKELPTFADLSGFKIPKDFLFYPNGAYPSETSALPDIGGFVRDFDSLVRANFFIENSVNVIVTAKYPDGTAVVNEGEFSSTTRLFRPTKLGIYTIEYKVINSAGKIATATFAILVYDYTPSFVQSELNTFEKESLPQKIAVSEAGAVPVTMPQKAVKDGYKDANAANAIEFDCIIFNENNEDVSNLIVSGIFTPKDEGWHRIVYIATNIAGNSVETVFYVQVYVPVPEFRNPQNLGMPETVPFFSEFSAATAIRIPRLTVGTLSGTLKNQNILWDYYADRSGFSCLTISLVVRKQTAGGMTVVNDVKEFEEAVDPEYSLFKPLQKGMYTFTFTVTNPGGGSISMVYSILVVGYAPKLNETAMTAFNANMAEKILLYKDYSKYPYYKRMPEFKIQEFLIDTVGDEHRGVSINTVVQRPDNQIATAAEWNAVSRDFKPQKEGGYIFIYYITNGSGETITVSYTVQVITYYPKYIELDKYQKDFPATVKRGTETRINPITAIYVNDDYKLLQDTDITVIVTNTSNSTQGNAKGEYTYNSSKGFYVFKPMYKGPYEFKFIAENAGGKTVEVVYNVYVTIEPPTIIFTLSGAETADFWDRNKTVHCGSDVTMPAASAYDELGAPITGSSFTATYTRPGIAGSVAWTLTSRNLKFDTVGDYTFRYVAEDSTGNERTVVVTVKCIDSNAPMISIIKNIDGFTYNIGNTYNENTPEHHVVLDGYGIGWTASDPGNAGSVEGSGIDAATAKLTIFRSGIATGWIADAGGGYSIKLITGNEGSYTAVYTISDKAGNQVSKYVYFTIKMPPKIISPSLPASLLGKSTVQLPLPSLDYTDTSFNTYCVVTDPEGVADNRNGNAMTASRNLTLSKPGKYTIVYFTRNALGIESAHATFNIESLRGDPIFDDDSRQNMLNAITSYQRYDDNVTVDGVTYPFKSGISFSATTTYPFPAILATDVFGDTSNYTVKLSLTYNNETPTIFEIDDKNIFSVRFRAEAIYKLTFIICYADGAKGTINPVLDEHGNRITFSDMMRVSGNGSIEFRYDDRTLTDFLAANAPGNYSPGVRSTTLFTMDKRPAAGRNYKELKFPIITAKGRINNEETTPTVTIYIYGPGSTMDDEGVRFMDALPVNPDTKEEPKFRAYEIGWYTIIYEARDSVGNVLRIQYKLEIRDEMPPEFTNVELFEESLKEKTQAAEVSKSLTLPIPDISDNYDAVNILRITVEVIQPNGVKVPIENYTFKPTYDGRHTVVYTVWDSSDRQTTYEFSFTVIPEVPPETPILGIAIGGIAGLLFMAGAVYLLVYKNVFRIKKLIPKNN